MEQFDIEEFAKMFDAALASDNPAVKKALRNFMMVTALVHAQEEVNNDERLMGPLETLLKQINELQHRVTRVEYDKNSTRSYPSPYDNTWIYNGPYPTVTSGTTTSSNTEWKYNGTDINEYDVDIETYLRDALYTKKGLE